MAVMYTYTFTNGKTTWNDTQTFDNNAEALAYATYICNCDEYKEADVDCFRNYITECADAMGEKLDADECEFELDNINATGPLGIFCPAILKNVKPFYSHTPPLKEAV